MANRKGRLVILGMVLIFGTLIMGCVSTNSKSEPQIDTYYVKIDGNDSNNGLMETAPFKTLAKAVSVASSSAIKTITVLGQLGDVATQIIDSGEAEILITGKSNSPEQEKAFLVTATGLPRFVHIIGKSKIRFEYITFTGGKANMLVVEDGAVVTLADGVVVTGNSAGTGGGVYADRGTIYLKGNAQITKNDANSGGGLFIQNNSTLVVEDNAAISSNRARMRNGGAINAQSGCTIIIRGSAKIVDNEAVQTGGGLCLAGNPPAAVAAIGGNAVISGNKASAGGGVVIWNDASLTITENAAITSNTATEQGGGGILQLGILKQEGGSITGNNAPSDPDIAESLQ